VEERKTHTHTSVGGGGGGGGIFRRKVCVWLVSFFLRFLFLLNLKTENNKFLF